MEPFFRIPS